MEIKAIAHLSRFKDIVFTLFKYGFDDVVNRLDLPGKMLIDRIYKEEKEMSTWERIRHTLEELGPTFIKFGQVISTRPDLVPLPLILELRKLQDEVAPEKYSAIRRKVEESFHKPLEEVFSFFEEDPLAAASLAQVHRAVLRENQQVVAVKVQRPGIRHIIETDLYILEIIARRLNERMEGARVYDLPGLVRELRRSLFQEIHFTHEVRNMKIARANFAEIPEILIPQVYSDYCTEQILTMELIRGTKLRDLQPDTAIDRKRLAQLGIRTIIKQTLEDGFFHADPHPGNLLILDDHILCLMDWGMVGRLTQESRYELIDLINGIVDKDSEKVMEVLLNFSQEDDIRINYRTFQREILEILDAYHSISLQEVNIGDLMLETVGLLRKYGLRIPMDLAVMIKALLTAEGVARTLYPELNTVRESEPYVRKLAMERWKPAVFWRTLRRNFAHMLKLQKRLPLRLHNIIDKLEHGAIKIRFQHENLGELFNTLENILNRLTLGVIIASMIIGSSMIITTGVSPFLFGYPALGVIGYMISGILGIWLIVNIIRSRKF